MKKLKSLILGITLASLASAALALPTRVITFSGDGNQAVSSALGSYVNTYLKPRIQSLKTAHKNCHITVEFGQGFLKEGATSSAITPTIKALCIQSDGSALLSSCQYATLQFEKCSPGACALGNQLNDPLGDNDPASSIGITSKDEITCDQPSGRQYHVQPVHKQ